LRPSHADLAPKGTSESLSARTLVLQHGVLKSGLWKGFSGAPTAAFAAVGYLARLEALLEGDDAV